MYKKMLCPNRSKHKPTEFKEITRVFDGVPFTYKSPLALPKSNSRMKRLYYRLPYGKGWVSVPYLYCPECNLIITKC